jgi:hypothetical protein
MMDVLRSAGHEVMRLKDYLPVESEDEVIIRNGQELDAVLLTLNGDFADIVSYPPRLYKGIVAVQMRNRPQLTSGLMNRLASYVRAHRSADHYSGKLLLVEVNRIRIRE